jgi:hypothetical protein
MPEIERVIVERDRAKPFGGLTPAEAAHRKAEKAREAREAREAAAEWDALTVAQRFGVAAARTLTQDKLELVINAAADEAVKRGATSARRFLLDVIRLTQGGSPEDESPPTDLDKASPAKRAALRAALDAFLSDSQGESPANEQNP